MHIFTIQSMGTGKVGRPKKYDKVMYWGMKVTPEEKAGIKILSQAYARPAAHIILDFVQSALKELKQKPPIEAKQRITTDELMALSKSERSAYLRKQAKHIAKEYQEEVSEYNEDVVE